MNSSAFTSFSLALSVKWAFLNSTRCGDKQQMDIVSSTMEGHNTRIRDEVVMG